MIPELQSFISTKTEPGSSPAGIQKSQDIDPQKLESLRSKLSKSLPVYTKVGIDSEEFKKFAFELSNPSLKDDKKAYDIWLTCWQYQTAYKLKLHQMIGHEGIKGSFVKSQEDFLVLAKAYAKIFDDKGVIIFAPYDKVGKVKAEKKQDPEKKAKKRDAKKATKDEEAAAACRVEAMQLIQSAQKAVSTAIAPPQLNQTIVKPIQNKVVTPVVASTVKNSKIELGNLSAEQEKILFNTQLFTMFQSINSSISVFKNEVNKKLDDLMSQVNTKSEKQPRAPRGSKKLKALIVEKENVVPEIQGQPKQILEAQKLSAEKTVDRDEISAVLNESAKVVVGDENQI